MPPITTLTVSTFLVPEPQESSVQLPNCFMLQKVGCLLSKEKIGVFYQQPQLLGLLIILTRLPMHSPKNTMLLFNFFPFGEKALFFLSSFLTIKDHVFLTFCIGVGVGHPVQ